VGGAGGVQAVAQHQPPSLLQAQLLLELQRRQGGELLEAQVQRRRAHVRQRGQLVDAQWLVEAARQLLDDAVEPARDAVAAGQRPQPRAQRPGQHAVEDLALHQRRQRLHVLGVVEQFEQAQGRIEQRRRDRRNLQAGVVGVLRRRVAVEQQFGQGLRLAAHAHAEVGLVATRLDDATARQCRHRHDKALHRVVVHHALAELGLLAALQHEHEAGFVDRRHRLARCARADQTQPGQGGLVQAIARRACQRQRDRACA